MAEEDNHSQIVYYSEKIISDESNERTPETQNAAPFVPMYSWQVKTERYAPQQESKYSAHQAKLQDEAKKKISFPGKFPITTSGNGFQTNVQPVEDIAPRKTLMNVDRSQRIQSKTDIEALLNEAGISPKDLLPIEIKEKYTTAEPEEKFSRTGFLPLEWFENSDDVDIKEKRTNDGEALLPKLIYQNFDVDQNKTFMQSKSEMSLKSNESHTLAHIWAKVIVNNYDTTIQKWAVTELSTMDVFKIPGIYLKFDTESPQNFVKRIKNAIDLRKKSEKMLIYELFVDCFILSGILDMSERIRNKIHKKILLPKKYLRSECLNKLEYEISLDYKRALAIVDFKMYKRKNPEFYKMIELPEMETYVKYFVRDEAMFGEFEFIRSSVKKMSLTYIAESIKALQNVNIECRELDLKSLFTSTFGKTTSLSDFVSSQQQNISSVMNFLKGYWLENMAGQICMCLRSVGKGHMDISIRDWYVYKVSKIYRLLKQVKYRMQDALQNLVTNSISMYCKLLCDPCKRLLSVADDYTWKGDLINSPFSSNGKHIFYLTLNIVENDPRYSVNLDEFGPSVLQLFDNAMMQVSTIHVIDSNVMSGLVFAPHIYLPDMKRIQGFIEEKRNELILSYQKAVIPLKAYAFRYRTYCDLFYMKVNEYIARFAAENRTAQQFKEEILYQRRIGDALEAALPSTISIGPFYVSLHSLKKTLVNKRQEMVKKLLESFTKICIAASRKFSDEFRKVMDKVTERPTSIEHIFSIKDYLEFVPQTVADLQKNVLFLTLEYDVLEYFFHPLTDEEFAIKWEAISWARKILDQIPIIRESLEEEIPAFTKIQMSDLQCLNDQLIEINEAILRYSRETDPAKAHEIAVEVRRTYKNVLEFEKQCHLLKKRQELFGLPTDVVQDPDQVVQAIVPYRDLWVACSDFLKLEELCSGNPLTSINIDDVITNLKQLSVTLDRSITIFVENNKLQEVAENYQNLIEGFQAKLDVITWIRSPSWSIRHWQELAKRANIDIQFSLSMNFHYCFVQGIMDHYNLVREIHDAAEAEAKTELKIASEEKNLIESSESKHLIEKRKTRRCRTDI